MAKLKVSATVDPESLARAKKLTRTDNVSELLDRGLRALIRQELERAHIAGYEKEPQGDEVISYTGPEVWEDLPWEDE